MISLFPFTVERSSRKIPVYSFVVDFFFSFLLSWDPMLRFHLHPNVLCFLCTVGWLSAGYTRFHPRLVLTNLGPYLPHRIFVCFVRCLCPNIRDSMVKYTLVLDLRCVFGVFLFFFYNLARLRGRIMRIMILAGLIKILRKWNEMISLKLHSEGLHS